MSTSRQVDTTLVIKARDEASRAISAIEGALADLIGTQKNLASGSAATSDGLAKVITTLAGLDKAYSTIAGAQDRAAQATTRQLSAVARSQADLAALQKQLDLARAAQERMNAANEKFVGPPTAQAIAQYKGVGAEVKNLQVQIKKLSETVDRQESGFTKSASDLRALGDATRLASAVTTFAAQAANEHTAALGREAAAINRVAALQNAISRSTDSTTGKSAEDSASVFQRAGLTDIEKQITATERQAAAERDLAAAALLAENALRARARREGNGQSAGSAADTLLASQLREEEAAAQAAEAELADLGDRAERLRAQMNPLVAIQDKLNRELTELPKVAAAGKFTTEELAAAELLLKKNADAAAKAIGQQSAGGGKPTLFGLKPYEIQNLSFQINDVVTQLASGTSVTQTLAQQGGQLLQIFPKVGSSIAAAFKNPYVIAFAATLGLIVVGFKELAEQQNRLRDLDGTLTAMGNAGTASAEQLNEVVQALDHYALSASEALKIVKVFLRDGLNPAYFEQFGRSAKDMADILGIDVVDAAKQLGDAFNGGYDGIVKLDEATNVYTASELKLIKQMFDEGRANEARTKAFEIFSQRMNEGAEKARGPWTQAINSLSSAWSSFKELLADSTVINVALAAIQRLADGAKEFFDWLNGTNGSSGPTTNSPSNQLAGLRKEAEDLQKELTDLSKGSTPKDAFTQRYIAALQARIADLNKRIATATKTDDTIATGPDSPETKRSNDILSNMSREQALQKLREDGANAVENLRVRNEKFLTAAEQRRRIALAGELAATQAIGDQRVKDAARTAAEDQERNKIQREQDQFNASATSPAMIARNMLIDREGFRSKAYWDVNHFRVGFGSDTTTSAGGAVSTVTKGTTVTLEDAIRDLDRRIKEFQDAIKTQIGADRFGAFSAQQQAALTSVAYNYGTLDRVRGADGKMHGAGILDTVRTGTTQQIAAAIRNLGGDNGGINRSRRNLEADTFLTPNAAVEADNEKQAAAAQQRQDKLNVSIKEANDERARSTAEIERQNKLQDEALVQQQITAAGEKAVADLQHRVAEQNANLKPYEQRLVLTQEQITATRQLAEEEARAQNARELAQARTTQAQRPVNDLTSLRESLRAQADALRSVGDTAGADAIETKLRGVDAQLVSAIDHAIAFFRALDPGTDPLHRTQEQIDAIIASLEAAKVQTFEWDRILGVSGETIANTFASTATNAIDGFAQSIANGENAFRSLGNAFRQFAADFLKQIAQMILQQAIFNAISGLFGGGGGGLASDASATIAANPSIFHAGGIAGSAAPSRRVSAAWFTRAARYHSGGIAGLLPNEVPAVLQRGEEILTANDPRHVANGGLGGNGPDSITINNLFDPGDMLSKGLATKKGEKSFFNWVSDNASAFEAALRRK